MKLEPKVSKKWGKRETKNVFHGEVLADGSLHVWGLSADWNREPIAFDRIFRLGDHAEFDSYNMTYHGEIVKITKNTVSIDTRGLKRGNARFALWEFVQLNWNFDLEEVTKRNVAISYTI